MRDFLISIGCILTLCLIMIGLMLLVRKTDVEMYNNGVCTECEAGHYNLVSGDRYNIYECDNCHHAIKTMFIMK